MDTFREFIESYTAVPPVDWQAISCCFESRIIEKDEHLLMEGEICRHFYFLESGLLRYFINKDGTEVTKFFTEAPYCFTSQASFTAEKPSAENIQALERSMIWQTTLAQATDLLVLKSWNTFVRKLIQEVQYYTEEILLEIQTETAEYRYEKLLQTNPAFVQRVALKHLASYLGIAPQSLSRIRKRMLGKDRR